MILPRTIRWRIQALYAVLFGILVCLLAVSSYREQRAQYLLSVDAYLNHQVRYLLPRFLPARPGEKLQEPPKGKVFDLADQKRKERNGYFAMFQHGTLYERSDNAPDIEAPQPTPGVIDTVRWHNGHREAIHFSPGGGILLAGLPPGSLDSGLADIRWHLILPAMGAWLVGILGGWCILHYGLLPLRRMSAEASDIASGRRETRIVPPKEGSELAELANTLNSTFDRLDDAYERQKRFAADASHELGTPLSVIISQTQLALARPREPHEYIAALESCSRAGQRMRSLTRDLLDLAEYDAGIPASRLIACDLAEIVREVIDELRPAADRNQSEITENLSPAPGHYHPAAISQVFHNLIQNAIKHNPPGTAITITTGVDGTGVFADVRDHGQGIPADLLTSLFERFRRGDKSRSVEGSGLGLAICQTILQAHNGTITVRNHAQGGACFHVRFGKIGLSSDRPHKQ